MVGRPRSSAAGGTADPGAPCARPRIRPRRRAAARRQEIGHFAVQQLLHHLRHRAPNHADVGRLQHRREPGGALGVAVDQQDGGRRGASPRERAGVAGQILDHAVGGEYRVHARGDGAEPIHGAKRLDQHDGAGAGGAPAGPCRGDRGGVAFAGGGADHEQVGSVAAGDGGGSSFRVRRSTDTRSRPAPRSAGPGPAPAAGRPPRENPSAPHRGPGESRARDRQHRFQALHRVVQLIRL